MATLEGQENSQSLQSEKQDICHLATLLVDVGMGIAQLNEENESSSLLSNDNRPSSKEKKV
jgi:hypothetical protein